MPRDASALIPQIDATQVRALLALVGPARVRAYMGILQQRLDGLANTDMSRAGDRAVFLSVVHQCIGSCKSMGLTAMSVALEDAMGKATEGGDISQPWAHVRDSLDQGRRAIEAVIAE